MYLGLKDKVVILPRSFKGIGNNTFCELLTKGGDISVIVEGARLRYIRPPMVGEIHLQGSGQLNYYHAILGVSTFSHPKKLKEITKKYSF